MTIDDGRSAQRATERGGGRGVEDVVVGQRLALERRLAGRERAVGRATPGAPVAGRRLVRVLAVAQRLDLLEGDRSGCAGTDRSAPGSPGSSGSSMPGREPRREHLGDPRVVGRGVPERLDRQRGAQPVADAAVRRDRRPGSRRSGRAT